MPSTYDRFSLVSDFEPRGDQERAIGELIGGLDRGDRHQVLLGVTGSGKTFTMAQVVAAVNRPTLVMAHNKTLAAQLYQEFRRFFPDNAVEYFVSYYDYYQPEAYMPATDSYIEKEATINEEIDRLRLSATRALFERRDVLIVASVSCIYGLGSPEAYYGMLLALERGQRIDRDAILRKLVEIQYERNDHDFARGVFRVRGDIIEVYPSYDEQAVRIELFGDEVDELLSFDPLTGRAHQRHDRIAVYPKSHFVMPREHTVQAIDAIKAELVERRAGGERRHLSARDPGPRRHGADSGGEDRQGARHRSRAVHDSRIRHPRGRRRGPPGRARGGHDEGHGPFHVPGIPAELGARCDLPATFRPLGRADQDDGPGVRTRPQGNGSGRIVSPSHAHAWRSLRGAPSP